MNVDADSFGISFDFYLRNACGREGFEEIFTELIVGDKRVAEVLFAGIPAGIPVFNDTDTKTGGIYFLTHSFTSSSLILLL